MQVLTKLSKSLFLKKQQDFLIKSKKSSFLLTVSTIGFASVAVLHLSNRGVKSMQAFVNGEIAYARTPIAGKLRLNKRIQLGNQLKAGEAIGEMISNVENPRVSTLRIEQEQLKSKIQTSKQQLEGINKQLANRRQLLNVFTRQSQQQQLLEADFAQQKIRQQQNELDVARTLERVALSEAQRYFKLAQEGAIDLSTAERKIAEGRQAVALAKVKLAELHQAITSQRAVINGLQIGGPRTLSLPEIRRLELNAEITDLQQQAANARSQILSLNTELARNSQELNNQQIVPIKVPDTGAIWSIDAQSGESLEANASLLQTVDCENTWIEAFVKESDANRLSIGQVAKVKLLGSDTIWPARIETLRAGTGRVMVGQYVVEPPPEIARRQLPVRVVTANLKLNRLNARSTQEFCKVGRSVEVSF